MTKMPTKDLVEKIVANKGKYFEAGMDNGLFCATRFLCFGGRKIYDTGTIAKISHGNHRNSLIFTNSPFGK